MFGISELFIYKRDRTSSLRGGNNRFDDVSITRANVNRALAC